MTVLNIGTFNVNRCRCTKKKVALFIYLQLKKKADVILFLQETHTDQQNPWCAMVIGKENLY